MERRPGVDELGADLEEITVGSTLAAILVVVAALLLVLVPAAIALHVPSVRVDWLAAGLGCLGAAVGGVKFVAMAWAAGTRLRSAYPARAVITYAE